MAAIVFSNNISFFRFSHFPFGMKNANFELCNSTGSNSHGEDVAYHRPLFRNGFVWPPTQVAHV